MKPKQYRLEISKNGKIGLSKEEESLQLLESSRFRKKPILFRNSVPEIPTTTYGAFAIYKYPAKFIPQVIAYTLKKYGKPNMKIFDPFAGYGTVGIVSRVYGFDYELWDLNPLIETIHDTILVEDTSLDLPKFLREVKNSKEEFIPDWNNLEYWFPEEFLDILIQTWGYVHSLPKETQYKILIPLIKVSRYFSWCDEKVHKLYKSKHSQKKVEGLLKGQWRPKFYNMLKRELLLLIEKLNEYKKLKPKPVNYKIRSGIDTLETNLEEDVNILISSPPYLQAQEYIRSTKLGLYWLGYDDTTIRNLSKKEIPYRKVEEFDIHSDLFYNCREGIETEKLKNLYDTYFHSILKIYSGLGERVEDYMCIFIGPASIRTAPVPIDDIIIEHLENFGWQHEVTYIDRIVGHVMFQSKANPATGLKNERIETEHLAILKRK